MILTLLAQYASWLLLIAVLLFGLAVWMSVRHGVQSRRAAYYALREEALGRARRWALMAALFLVAGIAIVVTVAGQPKSTGVAQVDTPTPTPATPTEAATSVPSSSPSLAPTLAPPKPMPSQTPSPTPTRPVLPDNVPNLLLTSLPSAVPPAASAKLAFTTLASVLDSNKNPVDPGLAFPAGTRSITVFFRASGVNNGATWSVFCLKGDTIADSVIDRWRWGTQAQSSRAFCSLGGSLGTYRVQAYLGTTKQFEVTFSLVQPAATPTETPSPTAKP